MANDFMKFKKKSEITDILESKKLTQDAKNKKDNFNISFKYLDTTQKFGSSFKDWQKIGLLSSMLETLTGYCNSPLLEQVDGDKFSIYGDFPSKDKTKFEYPKNVPEDARWARIHINGSAVVIGHVVYNTFNVVFLDKTHKFFLTKKARGAK